MDFRKRFPRPNISGKPTIATIIDQTFEGDTNPVIRIQFYPYPNNYYIIPYNYVTRNLAVTSAGVEQLDMSADGDEPNLPLRYRNGIVLQACAKWYRDKKDDARAVQVEAEYHEFVGRIVNDQRIGTNTTAQIQPKASMYAGYARAPYSGHGTSRWSTNNSFDDFRT